MPNTPISAEKKPQRSRLKRKIREGFAVCIWILAFVQLLVFDLLQEIAILLGLPSWVYQFRLLVVAVIVLLASLLLGYKRFLKNFGYIVLYPFVVVLWKTPKFLFLNWPLLIAFAPTIHSVASKLRIRLVVIVSTLIAGIIILLSTSHWLLVGSIAMIVLALFLYYYGQVRSIFSSETVFSKAAGFVTTMWEKTKSAEGFVPPVDIDMETEEGREKFGSSLLLSYGMTVAQNHIATKLEEVSNSSKLDGYLILSWVWTVCFTVLSFAFIYFGLSKIDGSNFSQQADIWGFVGYSICILTTSSLTEIEALSDIAKVTTYIELTGTVFILILMVFIVLTSQRDKYKRDLSKVSEELKHSAMKFETAMTKNFEFTVSAAEEWLLKHNEAASYYMKLKYGEDELKKLEEQVKSTVEI